MAITPTITDEESDVYNALSPDWIALTVNQKDAHIYNASVHMQTSWYCGDVDWDDTASIDDDIKRACAYYAEADRIGVLFDPMIKEDTHGKKIMERRKLDTMEKTTQWSMFGGAVNGNPLASVDAIMSTYCSYNSSTSVTRV